MFVSEWLQNVSMIKEVTGNKMRRVNPARPSGGVVGDHLPIQTENRKRCISCTKNKKDTHIKTKCRACNSFLCKNCFASWHLV